MSKQLSNQTLSPSERFDSFVVNVKTVGVTSVDLFPAGDPQKNVIAMTVSNDGTATIYIGPTTGVTTTTGEPIEAGAKKSFSITRLFTIFAISGTAGQSVPVSQFLRP